MAARVIAYTSMACVGFPCFDILEGSDEKGIMLKVRVEAFMAKRAMDKGKERICVS